VPSLPRDPWLAALLAVHTAFALLLWFSGSPFGTWTFECGAGGTAWDLAHGRNPAFGWSDYYDSWTSGYLLWALLEAPGTWLPGPPIYALKAVSLATTAAVVVAGYAFALRVADRATARLAAAGLALAPPTLWFYAVHAGDYHYSEILFELLLFGAAARVVHDDRWTVGRAGALGLLAGLAITTSFGAGLAVLVTVAAVLARRPRWAVQLPAAAVVVGGLVGLAPGIVKATLHQPFGLSAAAGEFDVPYLGSVLWGLIPRKLALLPTRLADHTGFADLIPALHAVDHVVAAGVLAAGLGGLIGAVRQRREDAVLAWLPGLFVAALLGTYLLLPLYLPERHPLLSDFRDIRWLPALLGAAAVGAPIALRPWPRVRLLLLVPALAAPIAWGAMIDAPSAGIPYPGRCYELQGLYAGKHVPLVEDGALARPDLCAGFDDPGACERGRAWAPAVYTLATGGFTPRRRDESLAAVAAQCDAAPPELRRPCYRHLGWALLTAVSPAERPAEVVRRRCRAVADRQARAWCHEGVGFWFADHLGGWPERLEPLLDGADANLRRSAVAGVGARIGLGDPDPAWVARQCARYGAITDGAAAVCEAAAN